MDAEEPRSLFWDYSDLLLFVCLAVPSFLLGVGIVRGMLMVAPSLLPGKAARLLTGEFIGWAVWLGSLAFLLRARYQRTFWSAMSWNLNAGNVFPSLSTGVLLALAVALIGTLLRTPTTDNALLELMNSRISILVIAFFATTLGPLCEELAFRGFLLPLLIRTLGSIPGVLFSALPFALLHGPQYNWSWQHLLLLTTVGCIFGWTRYKTGSTGIPTLMHASYNAVFMGAVIASKREYF